MFYKDTQNNPFYDPSESVIAQYSLTPISEEEFNSIVTAINTPTTEQLAESIRSKRNQLIADTDHMLLPDYPITSEQLIAVKAYRQELRDIPEQSGFPTNVIWPEGV